MEHYSGNDPETGCALIALGVAILLVVLAGAIVAFWVLT